MVMISGYAAWVRDLKTALQECRRTEARAKSSNGSFYDCMQYGRARLIIHRVRIGLTPEGKPRSPAPDWDLEEHYKIHATVTVHVMLSAGMFNQIMGTA